MLCSLSATTRSVLDPATESSSRFSQEPTADSPCHTSIGRNSTQDSTDELPSSSEKAVAPVGTPPGKACRPHVVSLLLSLGVSDTTALRFSRQVRFRLGLPTAPPPRPEVPGHRLIGGFSRRTSVTVVFIPSSSRCRWLTPRTRPLPSPQQKFAYAHTASSRKTPRPLQPLLTVVRNSLAPREVFSQVKPSVSRPPPPVSSTVTPSQPTLELAEPVVGANGNLDLRSGVDTLCPCGMGARTTCRILWYRHTTPLHSFYRAPLHDRLPTPVRMTSSRPADRFVL